VEKSIYELWNLDLQGNTIGALMDAFSKHYRVNIGLEKDDVMFNSGVMLIDLLKWKTNNIEDKVLSFIVSKNGKIQQGDQGALNAVLSHETYCFEPRFNAVTIFFDFTYSEMILYRKPPRFYSEEEIKNAVKNPTIVHFTTSFLSKRAWMKGCQHQYVEEWMRYKEMSPWKDSELWDDYRPIWKQKGLAVYKMFPSNMAVRIAGVMQVYGRPIVNMIMEKIEGKRQNSERRYSPNGVHDESVSVN
jgi:lipopolysaccharide biosynthesis glycosyltransferase